VTRSTARALYIAILQLHPRRFRSDFADDLLQTFEEAYEQYGAAWLICDLSGSLLRQRFLRRPEVVYEAAAPGYAVGLRSGVYPLVGPYEFLLGKLLLASLLTSILFQVITPM
jgi:hypothetical protein